MESNIKQLIAMDRIAIPLSSLEQKLRKQKSEHAKKLSEDVIYTSDGEFQGEKVYAFVSEEDKQKARGMKDAVSEFCRQYPKYGAILQGKIAEKRVSREKHLYFGINAGRRLDSNDYVEVMQSLGLTERASRELYPELIKLSRGIANKRDEERSIIVGNYFAASLK